MFSYNKAWIHFGFEYQFKVNESNSCARSDTNELFFKHLDSDINVSSKCYITNHEKDQFLHVLLPYVNFAKTKRRTQLFLEFLERYTHLSTIRIVIVEATVDEFILPNEINKDVFMHLKYKYETAIWCKENLINLVINKLIYSK